MRLFIAIDISQAVRDHLRQLVEELRRELPGPRWLRPEGIHLTLKFLGEVAESALPPLGAALRDAVAGSVAPFDLMVGGLGIFPDRGRPRVLWIGLSGPEGRLTTLHSRVERAVASTAIPGVDKDSRPFTPHLTLARFGQGRPPAALAAILARHRDGTAQPLCFRVSSVGLYQSMLRPGGAEYRRIEEYGL